MYCAWPSMVNVTLPVGVPVPEVGATVAVNVTWSPKVDGFSDETTVVMVETKGLTVWSGESAPVLWLKVESPLYVALTV